MKKLFFAGAIALFGAVNAQDSGLEGKTFVTGAIGFDSEGVSGAKTNSFSFRPAAGHFVSSSIAVGLGLGFENTKVAGASESVSTFSVVPFARKYWNVADNLYIFGQAALPFTSAKNSSSIGFEVAPGLDYFLSKNWSIETTLGGFGFNSYKPKGGKATTGTNLGVNLSDIKFGVKYVF